MYPGRQGRENLTKILYTHPGVVTMIPLHLRGRPNYQLEKARPEGALRIGKGMIPGDLHVLKIKDQMA